MADDIGWRENEEGEFVPVIDESIPDPIPMVGIFYFIDNKVLFDAVPAAEGKLVGNTIRHGSHYKFWVTLIPKTDLERKFKAKDYDAYPRGCVTFFPKRKIYRIDYDENCICFSDDISYIIDAFGLYSVEIEFGDDEHYRCSICKPR